MGANIDISDSATPLLERIHSNLAVRSEIMRAIGRAVVTQCKVYVQAQSSSRHATAEALGANPTGFLGAAADAIHFTATGDTCDVDFNHFWFSRVGHDVDIDKGDKYLAIPVAADAYGKRLRGNFQGGRFFRSPRGTLCYGMPYPGNERVLEPLYVLVHSVHQPQDRTRLPSDEEIQSAARNALADQIGKRTAAYTRRGI